MTGLHYSQAQALRSDIGNSGVRSTLLTGGIHKKVGLLLMREINPGGEHGRGCSHVADQDRQGKKSDTKSHDRGISTQEMYYLS